MKFRDTLDLVIDNYVIKPGCAEVIYLNAGKLPSGTKINMAVHIFRSNNPGPVILILGGIHGDEINGIEIVRKSVVKGLYHSLVAGTVIAIPLINVFGFNNFSRDMSDGKDVNRSFPGHLNGSLASRTARIITKKILPLVDIAIDFHTGGASRYNYPQIRYYKKDSLAHLLAHRSGAPFLVEQPLIAQSFRKSAFELKIPTLVYEGGESLRFDALSIHHGLKVIDQTLQFLNMLEKKEENAGESILVSKSRWLRAANPGIFYWHRQAGDFIHKGELLGVIHEPTGILSKNVISPEDGYIIAHNNACVVSLGDALFHLAVSYEKL